MGIHMNIRSAIILALSLVILGTTPAWAQNRSDKDQVFAFFQQGQEQLKVYHFKEAEAYFKKALEKDPSHCPSFMGLLHSYLLLEDLKSVRELLIQYPRPDGCTDTDKDYMEAILAEIRGKWEEALIHYEAIAKRDASDAKAYTYMAMIYLSQKEYTSGIEACQQAIKADPNFFLARNVLGRLSQAQGNIVGATAAFEKALQIFPNYAFGHASLGDAYLRRGMAEKARAQFEEAERLEPENCDLLAYIGNAFLATGKRAEAIRYYQKSLAVDPENAMIHYFLARIYLEEGEDEK
ncbi:MAG: tetratricopeptide repeat protein, partial [Desulfatiglandales bacterium]